MYYLTNVTFQGIVIVTLVVTTVVGMWWAEK
jgi:hypothetical protein